MHSGGRWPARTADIYIYIAQPIVSAMWARQLYQVLSTYYNQPPYRWHLIGECQMECQMDCQMIDRPLLCLYSLVCFDSQTHLVLLLNPSPACAAWALLSRRGKSLHSRLAKKEGKSTNGKRRSQTRKQSTFSGPMVVEVKVWLWIFFSPKSLPSRSQKSCFPQKSDLFVSAQQVFGKFRSAVQIKLLWLEYGLKIDPTWFWAAGLPPNRCRKRCWKGVLTKQRPDNSQKENRNNILTITTRLNLRYGNRAQCERVQNLSI